jgi:hypothetical protein
VDVTVFWFFFKGGGSFSKIFPFFAGFSFSFFFFFAGVSGLLPSSSEVLDS